MVMRNVQVIKVMIEEDLKISSEMINLLEKETLLTKDRDYIALSELIQEKSTKLEILQKNAAQRVDWLSSLNLGADENAWSMLLNTFNEPELQKHWFQVKNNLEKCNEINELNGKLISRGLNSHSRLLDIMRGSTAKADLYTAKGNRQTANSSISFTQA
jgi:flagella synthesis protein FlgN